MSWILRLCVVVILCACTTMPALADLPRVGDVILGLSTSDLDNTMQLVRGIPNMATQLPDPWNGTPFIQSVEFDNYNGISHNANGNILGVNFGTTATGGQIYSFATTAEVATGQLIGEPLNSIGGAVTTSRLGGLSVSPDNSKIAVTGNDTGAVIVYDYTPGDTMGGNAMLQNARETSLFTIDSGATQGSAWLDNNTVLAFSRFGNLVSVNATTMASSIATTLASPGGASDFSSLEFNPAISPYVWAGFSTFAGGVTTNKLWVLDPSNSYSIINEIDLSTSLNTMREIGFDAAGNLYLGQFNAGGTGPILDVLVGAAANSATIADNSSVDVYMTTVSSSFSGFDIALGGSTPMITGDFNNDGFWDCADINALTAVAAAGSNDLNFDLNGDNVVNDLDVSAWLVEGGEMNPAQTNGNPFLRGDANLDGVVDGQDFIEWNQNKFMSNTDWCDGNFNSDAVIDGQDFITWNQNKFMSSAAPASVPEPGAGLLLLVASVALLRLRRRGC